MAKESFILHTDAWPAIKQLTREQRGDLFAAVMCYQLEEELPELDPVTSMAFSFMAAQMDRDTEKYNATAEKRRAAAQARWEANQNANACKSMQNMQMHNLHYDTVTVTDTDTDTDTVNVSPKGDVVVGADAPTTTTTHRAAFKKPSLEEVRDYFKSLGSDVDPEAFMDYYEANGWKVGRNSMKDWKAAARYWKKREAQRSAKPPEKPFIPADWFEGLEERHDDSRD